MHVLTTVIYSVVLLLSSIMSPVLAQADMVATTRRLLTITKTATLSSPKITLTSRKTITTYGLSRSTLPPHTLATPLPSTHTHTSGKITGLLFAGGAVLAVFFVLALVLCHKRHKAKQEKRINEWVQASALHDRYSVLGNCGSPAAEFGVFRGGVDHELRNREMTGEAEIHVPQQVVVRGGKGGGRWE